MPQYDALAVAVFGLVKDKSGKSVYEANKETVARLRKNLKGGSEFPLRTKDGYAISLRDIQVQIWLPARADIYTAHAATYLMDSIMGERFGPSVPVKKDAKKK